MDDLDKKFTEYKNQLLNSGYLNLPSYLNSDEFEVCRNLTRKLNDYPEEIGGPMKYFEFSKVDQSVLLNRVEFFLEISNDFINLIYYNLLPLLHKITRYDFLLFKEKINFKMPGAGGFKAHQDAPAFKEFVDKEMLTVMIPLQDTDLTNGCLQVSNHFNKNASFPHIKGTIPQEYLNDIQWMPILQKKKDVLIFSSYLIHYSLENHSNSPRECYFLTFNPKSVGDIRIRYFNFKRKHFPPRVERVNDEQYQNWQSNLAREIF